MRMFYVSIQCFILGTINLKEQSERERKKFCFRCRVEDQTMTSICMNCKKALYCNRKCMKKNVPLHTMICRFFIENQNSVKAVVQKMTENYTYYNLESQKQNNRKNQIVGGR